MASLATTSTFISTLCRTSVTQRPKMATVSKKGLWQVQNRQSDNHL